MNSAITATQHDTSYQPYIEGLRAVAVLLVVACHCGVSWCAGGFIGVDVFFVLSGYLITGMLAAEYRSTDRIDIPRFFARRARRLVPALALVLIVTLLAAALALSPQEMELTGRAARTASLYISNIAFDLSASDYFAPQVEDNPLLHTWSLGVEEQFYLAWPLLLILTARTLRKPARWVWSLWVVTALSFACCLDSTRSMPTFAFYEIPSRAWEFAAGGILAIQPLTADSITRRTAIVGGFGGLLLILGAALSLQGGGGFPGWIAVLPVSGTLLILSLAGRARQTGVSAFLGSRPMRFLGARSYSWYLWHWPFLVFGRALFPGITLPGNLLIGIVSLTVACLTYSWIERPVRENAYLGARPGLSFRLAASATLLTIGACAWLTAFAKDLGLDRKFQAISASTMDVANIAPYKKCWEDGPSSDIRVCQFGAPGASQLIVLFGDSHAIQWINGMRAALDPDTWRLVTVVRPGCAASDINPHRLPVDEDRCKRWRRKAIETILGLRPSLIVMASYNGATMRGDSVTRTLMPAEEVGAGTHRTLEQLTRAGVPVVILRDSPLPPFNIPACIAQRELRRLSAGVSCDFEASIALNKPAFEAEQAAASDFPAVHFLDLSDEICPGTTCPATLHGLIVYRDENHLTGTFARSLAPSIRSQLLSVLASASRSGSGAVARDERPSARPSYP